MPTKGTLARPNKLSGRVVLGPRPVKSGYARIVALPDGSGRIELFDAAVGAWRAALDGCSFDEIWRAAAVLDARYLRVLTCMADS